MEVKTKTGKLVETYEKYLNDDIHELPDCRISKHTVKKIVSYRKIYLNFTNSKLRLQQVLDLPMCINGVYSI